MDTVSMTNIPTMKHVHKKKTAKSTKTTKSCPKSIFFSEKLEWTDVRKGIMKGRAHDVFIQSLMISRKVKLATNTCIWSKYKTGPQNQIWH